ncbi:NAD(P)H-hydrate dehydratase [Cryomorphaceae bacterium]|nr:NAD(P)H-hydrate dehydratase [Cryomorphaceae bacterium]
MKILSVEQIREADRLTIEREPISSIDLMERAAAGITDRLTEIFDPNTPFTIYCGMGNNGGDGLAIARQLRSADYDVRVVVIQHRTTGSPDFETNLSKLNAFETWSSDDRPEGDEPDRIRIDAILGSGLSQPLDGFLAEVCQALNRDRRFTIAVDVPTGIFADDNRENDLSLALRADATLTFQWPKRALLLPDSGPLCGPFELIDIDLDAQYEDEVLTPNYFVDHYWVAQRYRERPSFAHKNRFGHALLAAGARGTLGAAIMSARGALRSGVGLLTGYLPGSAELIWPSSVPEAMGVFDPLPEHLSDLPQLDRYTAIGVGPGIGQDEDTSHMLQNLIRQASVPLVFDADALNILAENLTWLSFCQQMPILTPHPGEFARLSGVSPGPDQYDAALEFAARHQCVLVLKGAYTATALPNGEMYFNSTGHSGLATGGSGDVLTGLLTGLRAQGYGVAEAAIMGVYLHGRAAELALADQSEESLLATDLPEYFGQAFAEL